MLQSSPVPGLRVREVECSGKLLHIVVWERGRASFSTEGGALRWRRHITSVTRVPAWPRERGVPGTDAQPQWSPWPASDCSLPHILPPMTPVGPALDIGLWRFIDEYDTVLDLNVFMVHNPLQEEMEV